MNKLIFKLGKLLNDKMYKVALKEYKSYIDWKLANPDEDDKIYFDFIENCCLEKIRNKKK